MVGAMVGEGVGGCETWAAAAGVLELVVCDERVEGDVALVVGGGGREDRPLGGKTGCMRNAAHLALSLK